MRARRGDWAKVTGGDTGIYYDGRRWRGFRCITCAHRAGVLINRRQLADVAQIMDRIIRERWSDALPCLGSKAHRAYIEATGHL